MHNNHKPAGAGVIPGLDDLSRRSALKAGILAAFGLGLMACTDEEAPVSDALASKAGGVAAMSGVTGKVTDAAGKPVVGALIAAEALPGTSAMLPELAIMTNADGVYTWPLPAGKFKLSVMVDGAAKASVDVESVEGKATTVDIALK